MDDAIEMWRNRASGQRGRILLEDRGHAFDRGIAGKGAMPGEHFVEDRAKRKDVGAVVGGFPTNLLRRHVPCGSKDQTGASRRRGGEVGDAGVRVWTLDQLRKPEVEDLRTALGSHEDVVRLQIAVNDAFGMCSRETKRDLCGEVRRFAKRKGPLSQHRCQRLAFEQLRHDVRDAAVHANVEHRHDVRVVECGRYPGLLFETPQTVGVLGKRRRQHFHGDTAVQARVQRAVDLAHATCANGLADFVGTKPRACRDSHRVIIATRWSVEAALIAGVAALLD